MAHTLAAPVTTDRAADKDRWHQLDDAIDVSGLPASDRAVFRALLKKADYGTADLPVKFTPTRQDMARRTGLSLRQVNYSVRHLARHGWLAVSGSTGRGHRPEYALAAGAACDCHGRVHARVKGATAGPERVQPDGLKGATVAPFAVQPKGATVQVNGQVVLRGTEREEERMPEAEPEEQDSGPAAWTAEQLAAGRRFRDRMEASGSDPWR